MNNCMFSGRVVRKPVCRTERRKRDNEKFSVAKFSLAVDDVHGNGSTVYPDFEIIGRQAEVFAEKVPKGTKICITRSVLKTESYTRDGEKVSKNLFRVHEWEFAESKNRMIHSAGMSTWMMKTIGMVMTVFLTRTSMITELTTWNIS